MQAASTAGPKASSFKRQASSLKEDIIKCYNEIRKKYMTIKELEKEIREKITVLDMDELKKVIKFIDQIQEDDLLWSNDTINNLKNAKERS